MAGPPEEHGDHARGMRVQDDEIAESVLRVGGAEHGRGVVRATVQADGRRALLKELKFLATPEKGEVSALLVRPEDATHLLVLGHGASTDMRHATLRAMPSVWPRSASRRFATTSRTRRTARAATRRPSARRPSARRSRRHAR